MVMDLPQYLIKNEIEIFAPLPSSVCIIDEVRDVGQEERADKGEEEEEELCIICMTNLAVSFLKKGLIVVELGASTLRPCKVHKRFKKRRADIAAAVPNCYISRFQRENAPCVDRYR